MVRLFSIFEFVSSFDIRISSFSVNATDFITVVTGLPRSGTSLMMQMLNAGGIRPLTDQVRAPDESNPRGYFEFEPVKRLRTDRSWLVRACGHAVKIIYLLVPELPSDGRFRYRLILMKRPMKEIVASQRIMLEREGKSGVDEAALARVYEMQLLQFEEWLRVQPDFATVGVNYHDALEKPDAVARNVNDFLGGGFDVAAMARVVDRGLYRQRASFPSKE